MDEVEASREAMTAKDHSKVKVNAKSMILVLKLKIVLKVSMSKKSPKKNIAVAMIIM